MSSTFWNNINLKICTGQHFVTPEILKSNKPHMFKLPDVKRAVSFPHFYISDVNKIQKKIPVMLKIHFSESLELFNSPIVKWRPLIINIIFFFGNLHEKALSFAKTFQVNNFMGFNLIKIRNMSYC